MKQFLKKYWLRLAVLLTAVVLTSSTLMVVFLSGKISAKLTESNGFEIKAYYISSSAFSSSGISDLSNYTLGMTTEFDNGKRISGGEYSKVSAGRFVNDTYGEYMLYRYNGVKNVIILTKHDETNIICFNLKSESETNSFYELLKSIMT